VNEQMNEPLTHSLITSGNSRAIHRTMQQSSQ